MDWLLELIKNRRLQGMGVGLAVALIGFVALTEYDVREFNALGFHITLPDTSASELERLRQENETLSSQISQYEAQIQTKDTRLRELENQLQRPSEQPAWVSELEDELKRTKTLLAQREEQIEKLKAEIASNDTQSLEGEVTTLRNRNEQLSSQISDYEAQISDQKEQIQVLENKVKDFSAELALIPKLQDEKLYLEGKIASLQASSAQSATTAGSVECSKPDSENEGTVTVKSDETWRGFNNQLRLRVREARTDLLDSREYVIFRSNRTDIADKIFHEGDEFTHVFEGCEYVIVIENIYHLSDKVKISIFLI